MTLIAVFLVGCGSSATTPTRSDLPTSAVASQTISTSKGQFGVPGTAHMDGRDEEASPPLTLMNINIWSGVPRQQVTCKLPHGEKVDLVNVQYSDSEGRYYFKVQSESCQGWVSEPFLSPSFVELTGDRIP
jgi:hypothetical protein